MNTHKLYLFFVLILILPVHTHGLPFISALEKKLSETLTKTKLPGCALAIINDNKTIYAKGFGYRDSAAQKPVTADTLFQIGSVTKGFTAALIAKLMTEGKIKWHSRAQQIYPSFFLSYKYHTEELTLKDILSQRSGLPFYAGDDFIQEGKDFRFVLKKLNTYKKLKPLGTAFSYQNSLFCLSQLAIEKNLGKNWHQAMQENLLAPLGIKNASSDYITLNAADNVAKPYELKDGQLKELPWSKFGTLIPAAGGLIMNIKDLGRYVRFQMNQGEGLIHKTLMTELQSPQVKIRCDVYNAPKYFDPKERKTNPHYCMGLFGYEWNGHKVISHGGYVNGMASLILFLPEQKIGMALLTNAGTYTNRVMRNYFLDLALGIKPLNWLKRAEDKKRAKEAQKKKKSDAHHIKPRKKARNIAKSC